MAVATKLAVAASDRAQLTSWVRAATTRRSLAERARIILLSAEGLSAAAIAERLGMVRLSRPIRSSRLVQRSPSACAGRRPETRSSTLQWVGQPLRARATRSTANGSAQTCRARRQRPIEHARFLLDRALEVLGDPVEAALCRLVQARGQPGDLGL